MDRRQCLATVGAGIALAVAGCLESGGDAAPTTGDARETSTTTTAGARPATDDTTASGSPTDGTTTGVDRDDTATVTAGPEANLVFDPETVRVAPGTTVRFVWDSDNHSIAVANQPAEANWTGTPGPRDETYDEGYEYEYTFEVAGRYDYYCVPHRKAGMDGTVLVDPDP
jgi:plastocyanin